VELNGTEPSASRFDDKINFLSVWYISDLACEIREEEPALAGGLGADHDAVGGFLEDEGRIHAQELSGLELPAFREELVQRPQLSFQTTP
jgi:hypothetical protein